MCMLQGHVQGLFVTPVISMFALECSLQWGSSVFCLTISSYFFMELVVPLAFVTLFSASFLPLYFET